MKRNITDEICNNMEIQTSAEMLMNEIVLWNTLKGQLGEEEYQQVEDKLYELLGIVEKEFFHYGFKAGVRFLLECM